MGDPIIIVRFITLVLSSAPQASGGQFTQGKEEKRKENDKKPGYNEIIVTDSVYV